jgi:hypothetical protein
MKTKFGGRSLFPSFLALTLAAICSQAHAAADRRFEVATFCCPCTPEDHLCQPQFDHLNWATNASRPNGHFLAMGSDARRPEIKANGNFLAAYYNDLNTGWTTMTGAQKADDIENNYILPKFTTTGVKPTWLIINEISAGTWPNNQTYRTWVGDCVARLKNTYNHEVIICSPFGNPAANNADWQRVSTYAYIGIEKYLSGQEINANGNSVSWCQNLYQGSKNSYINRGVPANKLYLVEHFGQTLANTGWGRSGCSYAGWDNAINARSTAARNVGFAGFVSYAWAKNAMLVSDADLIHFEDTHKAQILP